MDKFSAKIKESLNQAELPDYNPAHFDSISRELDAQVQVKRSKVIGSTVLVAGAALFLFLNNETNPPQLVQEQLPKAETVVAQPQNNVIEKDNQPTASAKDKVETIQVKNIEPNQLVTAKEKPQLVVENDAEVEQTPVKKSDKINDKLNAIASAQKFNVCEKEAIEFISDVDFPATYKWSFGDGTYSAEPNPLHAYTKAGAYKAYLVVTSLVDGRHKNVSIEKSIIVKAKPSGNILFDEIENDAFNRKMQFNTEGNHQVVSWIIKEKELQEDAPITSFLSKGKYPVKAIIRNEDNCYDTIATLVTIDKVNNLLAPTAFSPNGDGRNDSFLPKALEDGSVNFSMQILDTRTGSMVYQGSNNLSGWDGIDANSGKKCADGTYVWVVTVNKVDGTVDTFKGNVTLINN